MNIGNFIYKYDQTYNGKEGVVILHYLRCGSTKFEISTEFEGPNRGSQYELFRFF
jgi:hypothetical protein